MKNLFLNSTTYDIQLNTSYNLDFTSNQSEWLSQKIENRFKTFFEEWFANNELGIPYFQRILKKQVNLDEVNAIFLNELRSITGVSEILNFVTDYNNQTRSYTINYIVRTEAEIVEGSIII